MFPKNILFCAFKNYEYLKSRYPKRLIEPSAYVENDAFYYFNKKSNSLRTITMEDGHLWHQDGLMRFVVKKGIWKK